MLKLVRFGFNMYIMLFNTKMDLCMLKLPVPLCTWSITMVPHTQKDGLCYINIKVSYGFQEFRLNNKYQSYDKSSTLFTNKRSATYQLVAILRNENVKAIPLSFYGIIISFSSNWTLSNIGGTSRGSSNSNRSWVGWALSTNRGVACCF